MYSHFPLKWLIISVSLPEFRCGFIILVSYHFSEFRVWNPEELKTAPNGVECVFWSSRRKNGSLCELFALQNRMFLFVSFRACCVIAVAMIFPKQTRFYHNYEWVIISVSLKFFQNLELFIIWVSYHLRGKWLYTDF